MKLQAFMKRKWNYTALAFALPVVTMLVLMLIRQFEPFGNYSMLYSDMYHQYYPFFVAFRKALLSGDSLLYSWDVGMGMDYLGLISYYLASPLYLLSVLVPEGLTLEYFSLLMPIKLGCASVFFAIFLKKLFNKDDISITVFGSFYALCAWALGYQWNIMWLDTFALLPLVALGTVSLLKDKKFVLYTVTLFFSVFSNYYIGFFTCIFVFLLFFCYEICRWGGFKKFFLDLCRIAFFSALAIGMTAILELPALAALQTTQSSVNKFPEGFRLNIASEHTWLGLLDAMRQVAGHSSGGLEPTFKEGLPNLYCGILSNILAFLFLTCKQVKLRDKLCSVFLLLFFNVSFIIRQLDYIWHGFHFTNMIPYRFSFLYSFVMLYMAYRAYLLRNRFRLWQIITAGILAIGIMICCGQWEDPVFWSYNGVFLLLYLTTLVYTCLRRKMPVEKTLKDKEEYCEDRAYRKRILTLALPTVMALELVLNVINFAVNFPGTSVSNYPKGTEDTTAVLEYMHAREADNLFFRAESTHSQTLNDGALNGYKGISTFTSSANVRVTEFMQALGYGAKNTYNRYCFEESSPVANLFLNLKYMLERDGNVEKNDYFDTVHQSGDVYLLENNAYLPLGFLADSGIESIDFSIGDDDPFWFQNHLFTTATGIQQPVWDIMVGSALTDDPNTAHTFSLLDGSGNYTTEDKQSTLTISYTATAEGLVCTHLELPKRNSFSVWLNGEELYSESYSLPQMLSISNVVIGDVVEIKITCKAEESSNFQIRTAVLNEDIFRAGYDVLNSSTLELDTFRNTYVSGSIRCDRDGLLYTSIPQDGNWHVTVDGKETEPALVGDAMISIPLTEGYHTVAFRYQSRAFDLGWKISLVCLILFLVVYVIYYRPFFRKGKYEK